MPGVHIDPVTIGFASHQSPLRCWWRRCNKTLLFVISPCRWHLSTFSMLRYLKVLILCQLELSMSPNSPECSSPLSVHKETVLLCLKLETLLKDRGGSCSSNASTAFTLMFINCYQSLQLSRFGCFNCLHHLNNCIFKYKWTGTFPVWKHFVLPCWWV